MRPTIPHSSRTLSRSGRMQRQTVSCSCLKAHRFSTVRKTKDDMKTSVGMFLGQGITSLKEKLGPINWQFPATRKFDAEYFRTFLSVLPKTIGKLPLRHALEVRGAGFDVPEFYELLSKHDATVVYAEDDEFPKLRHEGSSFVVARLMQTKSTEPSGYTAAEIARFAKMLTAGQRSRTSSLSSSQGPRSAILRPRWRCRQSLAQRRRPPPKPTRWRLGKRKPLRKLQRKHLRKRQRPRRRNSGHAAQSGHCSPGRLRSERGVLSDAGPQADCRCASALCAFRTSRGG